MADRILLVDMGNTHLKWVWAEGGHIDEGTSGRGDSAYFFKVAGAQSRQTSRILVSSVAGVEQTSAFMASCNDILSLPVKQLISQKCLAGIVNGYDVPATLGVDRWLAIVGAAHAYGTPVVVMDLGTATTLDAVDESGQHLGGLILPGPVLMLNSLARGTAMKVPCDFDGAAAGHQKMDSPGVGPARSTSSAILEGIYSAQIGSLTQFLCHVSAKLASEPKLVLTGGAAEGILGRLQPAPIFDPWLVFKGMLQDQD